MDLYSFIQKLKVVKDSALRGDWTAVLSDGFPLLLIALQAWQGPRPVMGSCEGKSVKELCDEINKCCTMTFGTDQMKAAPTGPFIQLLWPALKALIILALQNL